MEKLAFSEIKNKEILTQNLKNLKKAWLDFLQKVNKIIPVKNNSNKRCQQCAILQSEDPNSPNLELFLGINQPTIDFIDLKKQLEKIKEAIQIKISEPDYFFGFVEIEVEIGANKKIKLKVIPSQELLNSVPAFTINSNLKPILHQIVENNQKFNKYL